ncbi:uncharacterized protein C16orf96 homolog isoform X3 [Symsagittifera roscoffensis]|uniref:uncharacterized protein C16orf96 homolog isoform X3 n=1 Tax=Symsagittifera roscoffensis TaxID=84072 RepID=UPI00307BF5CA
MAPQTIADLIDLSLGSPEVGAVNFNILHSVLHQLVKEVGLGDKAATPPDLSLLKTPSKQTGKGGAQNETQTVAKDGSDSSSSSVPYHAMLKRINELEGRLRVLDNPDQKQVNEDTMLLKEHGGKGVRPVSDMWTLLQTQRRSQSNEEMITKLSSMMEDLLSAHQKAKADNDQLKAKINQFNSLVEQLIKTSDELKARVDELESKERGDREDIDKLKERMQSAHDNLTRINSRLEGVPTDFSVFALKKEVDEKYSTKDELDKEMMKMMALLDKKASEADMLEVKEKLSNIPSDLMDQLDQMAKNMESLRLDRDSDADTIASLQTSLDAMQNEVDKIQAKCQFLMDEGKSTRNSVIDLDARVQTLDMIKADKETIQIEIDLKADKRALDSKIGRTLFDEKTGEIDEEIGTLKFKLGGAEEDYKKALDELLKKLDAKLDKDELGPLKEWLENKLKGLKPKLIKQEYRLDGNMELDDAAGFRKSSTYFCLSCDKKVRLNTHPVPTFPSYNPLPPSRSARPYTTYELDQIRQAQRLMHQDPDTVIQPYNRPAGGPYTSTHNKRMQKAQQIAQMIEAEETAVAAVPEVELMGVDGRIYKGRTGEGPAGMPPGIVTAGEFEPPRGDSRAGGGVELPDIQQRSGRRSAVLKSAKRSSARGHHGGQGHPQKLKPSTPVTEAQHPVHIDPDLINSQHHDPATPMEVTSVRD